MMKSDLINEYVQYLEEQNDDLRRELKAHKESEKELQALLDDKCNAN